MRLARQVRLLVEETGAGSPRRAVDLTVAVNADSLATWFSTVLDHAARWLDASLRLTVEDEGRSHDLLRRGEVLAAVTSDTPLQGCVAERLGGMRHRAAAPALIERHRRARGLDWAAAMPLVIFNDHDRLHDAVRRSRGVEPASKHHVPSSADLLEAVRLGLGWATLPDQQVEPDRGEGPWHFPWCATSAGGVVWHRWSLFRDARQAH